MIRAMQAASAGLERIVVKGLRHAMPGEAAVLAWPLACGNRVATRTRALEYADGILRVEVSDARWKKELQGMAAQYLAILNRYVSESVARIEFVVSPAAPGPVSK